MSPAFPEETIMYPRHEIPQKKTVTSLCVCAASQGRTEHESAPVASPRQPGCSRCCTSLARSRACWGSTRRQTYDRSRPPERCESNVMGKQTCTMAKKKRQIRCVALQEVQSLESISHLLPRSTLQTTDVINNRKKNLRNQPLVP